MSIFKIFNSFNQMGCFTCNRRYYNILAVLVLGRWTPGMGQHCSVFIIFQDIRARFIQIKASFDVGHSFFTVFVENGESLIYRVLNDPFAICQYFRPGDAGALRRTCT